MNPWLLMWGEPRKTVRAIVDAHSSYGVLFLSFLYVFQEFFFYANYWSLGVDQPLLFVIYGVISSVLVGILWIYFSGLVYYCVGYLMGGKANQSSLRVAIAWSKIPMTVSLFMWFVLILMHPDSVFVQDRASPSFVFIYFITFVLVIWSFVLLVQGVREIQRFSIGKSILNCLIGNLVYFIFIYSIVNSVLFATMVA
jgi:hypothetical protein